MSRFVINVKDRQMFGTGQPFIGLCVVGRWDPLHRIFYTGQTHKPGSLKTAPLVTRADPHVPCAKSDTVCVWPSTV